MKNTLKIDFAEGMIIMDRTFAKLATNTHTPEYTHLQEVRRDYPDFKVIQHTITRNVKKKTYAGLTYDYMKEYIITHGPENERKKILADLNEMILISECHSKAYRYPVIKKWFLSLYPEIANYGLEFEKEKTGNVDAHITETAPLKIGA